MKSNTRFSAWFLVAVALQTLGSGNWSQLHADDEATMQLKLHAIGEPDPVMRHRLLPEFSDLIDGNATVWYGKVFAEQQAIVSDRKFWDKYDDLMKLPLEQLRSNSMVRGRVTGKAMFGYLEKAAHAKHCDWQLRIRHDSFFSILLPDIQQSRSFARLLALRARYYISQGDFDTAIATLQSGIALARNVASGETVPNALVGAAIHRLMMEQVLELVAQPGAPNLYWAITALPKPAVDFRPALEAELAGVALTFPVFTHLESEDYSSSYWTEQLREFWEGAKKDGRGKLLQPVEFVVMQNYSSAKQRLISDGWDRAAVDAMPVARVVLLDSYLGFERNRQRRYRWTYLPYPQAIERLEQEKENAKPAEALPLTEIFDMRVAAILKGQAITQLYVELARTIEAIRLHAAHHDGGLPGSLAEIDVVPVPNDPMTSQPFPYRVEDGVAVITPAAMDWKPNRFEITIANRGETK